MKVLLIDDHPLILSALQSVIQGLGDDVEVTAADSGQAARTALARSANYDLALLDLHLGDLNGFDLLSDIRENYPSIAVVVVSASDRTSDVIRSIDMGAMGFVSKRSSNETLVAALRQVMSGGVYVPPMSMGTDSSGLPSDNTPSTGPQDLHSAVHLPQWGLTPRQTDVLASLLKGHPNKLIARELNLSVETVKDHVAAVLRALGVSSRTQAVIAVSQALQKQPSGFSAWRPVQR
ncbi:MAG TPA: response regulator transcription factor [Aquabacterium sp.]|nr:response regulator transcription factor [Aquabacterium sp.]